MTSPAFAFLAHRADAPVLFDHLLGLGDVDCYTESALQRHGLAGEQSYADVPANVRLRPLADDVAPINSTEEAEVYRACIDLAGRMIDLMLDRLTPVLDHLDLPAHRSALCIALQDRMFLHLMLLRRIMLAVERDAYGSAWISLGSRPLSEALQAWLHDRLGAEHVHFIDTDVDRHPVVVLMHKATQRALHVTPRGAVRRLSRLHGDMRARAILRRLDADSGFTLSLQTFRDAIAPHALGPEVHDSTVLVGHLASSAYLHTTTALVRELLDVDRRCVVMHFAKRSSAFARLRNDIPEAAGRERVWLHDEPPMIAAAHYSLLAMHWCDTLYAVVMDVMQKRNHLVHFGLPTRELLAPAVHWFITKYLPFTLDLIQRCERTLQSQRPSSLIVTPGRLPEARIMAHCARTRGITTVDVQAVAVSANPRYQPPVGDVCTVIESEAAELYASHFGIDPRRIVQAGSVAYDTARQRAVGLDAREVRQRLIERADRDRLVVFASQTAHIDMNLRCIRALLKAIGRRDGTNLIIKLHPGEDESRLHRYRMLVAERGAVDWCRVSRDLSIDKLLVACDLMTTMFSNVAVEAAILDKPVLVMNLEDTPHPVCMETKGLARLARSPEQVAQLVDGLLDDPRTQQDLQQRRDAYFMRNPQLRDGRCARTVVQAMLAHEARETNGPPCMSPHAASSLVESR
jgi:hypothetical protein